MTKIRSNVRTLAEILFAGRLTVPWHQRYFDWRTEQVEELLDDIIGAVRRNMQCYFIGSIMLVESNGDADRELNDGQQRMVTLSLLIAALCRRFDAAGDGNSVTVALRALFDRPADQASRTMDVNDYRPRLRLSRTDRSTYEQIIRGNSVGSNGRLVTAFESVERALMNVSPADTGRVFRYVMRRLELAVLRIPKETDANSFFEALNARGKPLDDVDLIRNRFYSYFSKASQSVRRETVHNSLEQVAVVTGAKAREYYRCYLQCQYGFLRKQRLYRDTREHIETTRPDVASHVYDLVQGLGSHGSMELFRLITSSHTTANPEFNRQFSMPQDGLDRWMHDLRRYSVSHPVIFALLSRLLAETDPSKRKQTKRRVQKSLENMVSFVLRTAFVSPKFEPSRLDAPFAELAKQIRGNDTLESLDIMGYLDSSDDTGIIDDASFVRQLRVVQLRDSRRALALLFGVNALAQDLSALRRTGCSVEHVLPKSPVHWGGWPAFGNGQGRDYVFRIGNMVVLPKAENRGDAKFNQSYDEKRHVFGNSTLVMARELGQRYREWTPRVIEERCEYIAEKAARTWKFVWQEGPRGR